MKPLAEAQAEVWEAMTRLPVVSVNLEEALGMVLAEEVIAPHDVPTFPNSAMDGYAVRRDDVTLVPTTLEVIEDVPAGSVPQHQVTSGTAIKIMTGAPLPDGADLVVRVEDTTTGEGKVTIMAVAPVLNIRPAGGDVSKGDKVLAPGIRMTPTHLGLLATIGVTQPKVFRRARVALLSTGDEVLPPETEQLPPGKIRDANRPLLKGLLTDLGVEFLDLGIVGDDPVELTEALLEGSSEADIVVSSGGVSMGEYDLVKQVLADLGEVELWQVAMKPAKPFAFGFLGDTPFFGLPGNPVSALVGFEQFLRPALLTAMGATNVRRPQLPAVAGERLVTDPEKTVFLRVNVSSREGKLVAELAGGQGSHVLSAAAGADGFAVVPVGEGVVERGEPIILEMFRWPGWNR